MLNRRPQCHYMCMKRPKMKRSAVRLLSGVSSSKSLYLYQNFEKSFQNPLQDFLFVYIIAVFPLNGELFLSFRESGRVGFNPDNTRVSGSLNLFRC